MSVKSTTIKGYVVDLELDDETSSCFISKSKYSSSLEHLLGMGTLYDARDNEHTVPGSIIGDIENWAYANGY